MSLLQRFRPVRMFFQQLRLQDRLSNYKTTSSSIHTTSFTLLERNYYEVLGVPKNASDQAIKTAYFNLAKKYHPDANHGDSNCAKKFQEVSEAYNVLSNPEKRKNYDLFGNMGTDQGNPYGGFAHRDYSRSSGGYDKRYYYTEMSPDEAAKLFESILKEFEKTMSTRQAVNIFSNTKYAQKNPIKNALFSMIANFVFTRLIKLIMRSITDGGRKKKVP